MSRLANLITTAATAPPLRRPWTSAELDALNGTERPPCMCGERCLAVTHYGEWFCPTCNTWLHTDHDPTSEPPANPPAIARRFISVWGRAIDDIVTRDPRRWVALVKRIEVEDEAIRETTRAADAAKGK